MTVCDVCKNNSAAYERWVTVDANGHEKKLDMCGKCYTALREKEKEHAFLAYKEVVNVSPSEPVKLTWLERLGLKKRDK